MYYDSYFNMSGFIIYIPLKNIIKQKFYIDIRILIKKATVSSRKFHVTDICIHFQNKSMKAK